MKYQKLNIILGWITFAISAFVYISTIEPSASFWDCGEFIATGYKLEVGHPPGAPFFMLLVNFFTQFAGSNTALVPVMANIMSALASAFTILFLFWTITHLAKKMVGNNEDELTLGQQIAILGSGLIGALVYTFSDTFWFSAVEGEVYATSSLITAFVFWAILKWENIADEKYSNRWIVLIAYVVGLSIGVHLLNLLAIPAMVLVYYFRKYTVTPKGIIYSLLISLLLLGSVMWVIIPGMVKVAFVFDRIFVNGIGLGFNSGVLFFIAVLIAAFAFGIHYTYKKNMPNWNTLLLAFAVMLIGYGSYAVTVIRSCATPPIDQNNPEEAYSLLSYLNREQYGENPLFFGQYYNAPVNMDDPYKEGAKTWTKKGNKYVEGRRKIDYNYNDKMTTFFPRMYSPKPEHVADYKYWAKIKGYKVKCMNNQGEMETLVKPTFGENLTFFVRYQVGFMYLRYFMWNFAGRQNDIQGNGDVMSGNWISGIKFLDEARLGQQDNLPSEYANNRATNKLYFLPLILGILGLLYQYSKDKRNFWVVTALFILTGFAILVYLNQTPRQPRERDYAYAGSFYAFAIWIGFGVLAIYDVIIKYMKQVPAAAIATGVSLIVPAVMCAEEWDDHDRSNRYIARDIAYNYLQSCEKNGIIFTNGDNDTFPLWYIQEVEGVRTDVRIICLPYLITDWYIDQMKSQYYDSKPVPFSLKHDQYLTGVRDQVPVFEKVKDYVELSDVIKFVGSDDPKAQLQTNYDDKTNYFPTKKFKITVDKNKVLKEGVVRPEDADKIVDEIKWNLTSNYVLKNDLMILDLLASANWERPIYMVSVGSGNETNIRDYFQDEGFAYRFVPIQTKFDYQSVGRIDTKILYDNMMNKFRWGNMGDPKVYLDENIRRTIRIVKIRSNFARLAMALQEEGKTDSAQTVLNRCLEVLPVEKMKLDYFDSQLVEAMFKCNMTAKGIELSNTVMNAAYNDMKFYAKMTKRFGNSTDQDKQMCMYNAQWVVELIRKYNQPELLKDFEAKFEEMYTLYMGNSMPAAQ